MSSERREKWLLCDPEINQNLNGIKQRIRMAINQDPALPITGRTTELIELKRGERVFSRKEMFFIIKKAFITADLGEFEVNKIVDQIINERFGPEVGE